MGTNTNSSRNFLSKNASTLGSVLGLAKETASAGAEITKGTLTLAGLGGILGGVALGTVAANLKAKNEQAIALSRKKDYYLNHVAELKNELWLNELIKTKKRLQYARLDEDERAQLETYYKDLLAHDS